MFLPTSCSVVRSGTLPKPLCIWVLNFPKHKNFTILLGCPQDEKAFPYPMSKLRWLQHLPTTPCSPSIPWCGAQVHHLGTLPGDTGGDAVRHLQNHWNCLCECAEKI